MCASVVGQENNPRLSSSKRSTAPAAVQSSLQERHSKAGSHADLAPRPHCRPRPAVSRRCKCAKAAAVARSNGTTSSQVAATRSLTMYIPLGMAPPGLPRAVCDRDARDLAALLLHLGPKRGVQVQLDANLRHVAVKVGDFVRGDRCSARRRDVTDYVLLAAP